jgi:hypothetical protein
MTDLEGRNFGRMTCDFMHHDRGFAHDETGAAKFFWHRDAKPAGLGHRAMKLKRKHTIPVARQPINRCRRTPYRIASWSFDGSNSFTSNELMM